MITTTCMGIVHVILSQPQHFLPSWPPVLAKDKQLQCWFGPNHMYAWLQTAAEALQSYYWFMREVYKAWDVNSAWIFHPNTPFTAKPTLKVGHKWPNLGLFRHKSYVHMVVYRCRSIPNSKLDHKQVLWQLGWELYMSFQVNHNIFWQADPQFCPITSSSRANLAQMTCGNCCNCCRRCPKSKLVHEQDL